MYSQIDSLNPSIINHGGKYDFLVVMGVGLGLHISEILDTLEVQNLLILETDFELLTLSCFFTDWQDIYERQAENKKKSITLVAINSKNLDVEHGSLWNELIKRAPHFPYNTVFYNHGRHHKYGDLIRKIKNDQKMFMSLWGFYDDETAQYNNIIYNLTKIVQPESYLIPAQASFKWNMPVIVCGTGPSLDSRIAQIKSMQDNCIVITAGTSLMPILRNGIVPDFHLELESDYSVIHSLNALGDSSILKKIPLITGVQSTPSITNMFKDVLFL